jgi:hypothetical protein
MCEKNNYQEMVQKCDYLAKNAQEKWVPMHFDEK